MSLKPELQRDWYFTPGAEWIVWDEPQTGKCKAFRVILTGSGSFIEWSEEEGFHAGSSDEGERPGRAKMAPVLNAHPGAEVPVGRLVLAEIEKLRRDPPTLDGAPIRLPKGMLDFIADQIAHMPGARGPRPT